MNNALLDELPTATREMSESAGYRVVRWQAAREVLRNRVEKGRVTGELGEFLVHWLAVGVLLPPADEISLTFSVTLDHLWLTGGRTVLVESPLERALLHLPALRRFWDQELRLRHFEALRTSVPAAWMLDAAAVPPGAVIHGLGITAWEQLGDVRGRELVVWCGQAIVALDLPRALAARNHLLCAVPAPGRRITAEYQCDEKGQIVLRSIAASS